MSISRIVEYRSRMTISVPTSASSTIATTIDNNNNQNVDNDNDFPLIEQLAIDSEQDDNDDPDRLDYDDCSEDDEADEEEEIDDHISNIKNVQNSLRASRNNSWTSFMTRSERNALLGNEQSSIQEGISKKHRIQFRQPECSMVHEIPSVTSEEKKTYWYHRHDLDRIDTEIKMTLFRWQNHIDGKIPFNEKDNTIRGLELILVRKQHQQQKQQQKLHQHHKNHHHHKHQHQQHQQQHNQQDNKNDDNPKPGDDLPTIVGGHKTKHVKHVIQEIHRQIVEFGKTYETIDWEHIRHKSQTSSHHAIQEAIQFGQQDEHDRKVAWDEMISIPTINNNSNHSNHNARIPSSPKSNHHPTTTKNTKGTKNQSRNPLFFWQKSNSKTKYS